MKRAKEKNSLVGLKELRLNLEKYIARVEKGESMTVIRRSKPVFRIAPVDDKDAWERVIDFTEIDPRGVPAEKVLEALRSMHG